MKLGHIAIFTEDMNRSITFYEMLGGKVGMRGTLDCGDGRSKDLAHMVFDGDATVELVCPSHEDMMIRNTGVCEHICFDVDNVDECVAALRAQGVDTFDRPEPSSVDLFDGIRIIFFIGPNGETIELFQKL